MITVSFKLHARHSEEYLSLFLTGAGKVPEILDIVAKIDDFDPPGNLNPNPQ